VSVSRRQITALTFLSLLFLHCSTELMQGVLLRRHPQPKTTEAKRTKVRVHFLN
jgi:hypothetical protein